MRSNIIMLLLLALTITSAAIFYPDKEGAQGPQQYKTSKFESKGFNYNGEGLASDRGVANLYMQQVRKRQEPALMADLERRAEKLPGVLDIAIISYLDNVIVGVLTDGRTHADIRNTSADSRATTRKKPSNRMYETTDGYHKEIIRTLRPRLTNSSRYNNIFISTSPAMYERISELHERIQKGEPVRNEELIVLLNDIGYTTRGYDLVH